MPDSNENLQVNCKNNNKRIGKNNDGIRFFQVKKSMCPESILVKFDYILRRIYNQKKL